MVVEYDERNEQQGAQVQKEGATATDNVAALLPADADEEKGPVSDHISEASGFSGRRRRGSTRARHFIRLGEAGEAATYPPDCYSFLAIHGPFKNPFFFAFGMMVFSFQLAFLTFLVMSRMDPRFVTGEKDSPSDNQFFGFIPSDVSTLARTTQITAVLSYCIFADSSLTDCATAVEQFPRFNQATLDHEKGSRRLAFFSCALRLIQGLLSTLCALLLIITSAEVVDVILNFTAINFISSMDERAFDLAKWGKYGPQLEEEAKSIESRTIPYYSYHQNKHRRYLCTVAPIAAILLTLLGLVIFGQERHWVTKIMRVEFRDSSLVSYNGCYALGPTTIAERKVYTGFTSNESPGVFGYCKEDQRWVLFDPRRFKDEDSYDACVENPPLYSSDTDTFDISTSFDQLWFSSSGETPALFFFDEDDIVEEQCGSFLGDGHCDDAFNTLDYQFDKGDCCASTCRGQRCGVEGITNAFGVGKSGSGYPNCTDPDMVPVTILLNSIKSSRDVQRSHSESILDGVTDEMLEKFRSEKGIDFWEETPNDAYFVVECDGTNVLLIFIDDSMQNQTETIMVKEGRDSPPRCKISVSNSTNDYAKWSNDPIWWVNYTVYDGNNTTNEIVSGDSGYQQSIDFHRIPNCYFDELEDWIKPSTAYVANNTATKSLQWLVNDSSGHSHCDDTFLLERFALSAMNFAAPIKADTNAIADTLWISTQQHCSWETITCEDGYVTVFSVRKKGLSGTIPTSIGLLTGLQSIEYDKNGLSGTIPTEMGLLTELIDIDFDKNALTGTIPTELGNLQNIVLFELDENALTGSIPTEVGRMTSVRKLDLRINQLSGLIPTELGHILSLTIAWLNDNQLSGSMPTQLGKLNNLEALHLNTNKLSGSIPSEIGLMTSLQILDLRDNSLQGTLPSEIGLLSNLTAIRLEGNKFTGIIPFEVASLKKLEIATFDASLTGDIPDNIKTMQPCVLCNGSHYELKNTSTSEVLRTIGPEHISCPMLLDKQKNTEEPFAADECRALKENCLACSQNSSRNFAGSIFSSWEVTESPTKKPTAPLTSPIMEQQPDHTPDNTASTPQNNTSSKFTADNYADLGDDVLSLASPPPSLTNPP